MGLVYSTPVKIDTTLCVEDVARGLGAKVVPLRALLKSRTEFPVGGSVGARSCKLYSRGTRVNRNTFPRVLVLDFKSVRGRTELSGYFRPNLIILTIAGGWAAVCLVLMLEWVFYMAALYGHGNGWLGAGVAHPPFFGIYGLVVLGLSLFLSRSQEQAVVGFVEDTLHQAELLGAVLKKNEDAVMGVVLPPGRVR